MLHPLSIAMLCSDSDAFMCEIYCILYTSKREKKPTLLYAKY